MRKICMALVSLALLATAPAAATEVGLHASWWDAGDAAEVAGGGLSLHFPVRGGVGIETRGTYFERGEVGALAPGIPAGRVRAIPVDLGARWNLRSDGNFVPYLSAGGSYIFLDHNQPGAQVDDELGWYAQLGTRFGATGRTTFFADATWREIEGTVSFGNGVDIQPDVPVDLGGVSVQIGMSFRF